MTPKNPRLDFASGFCDSLRVGISPQQFEQMQKRMSAPRRAAAPVSDNANHFSGAKHQIILGVDPSLRGTGFGVIKMGRPRPSLLAQGTIHCAAGWERSRCLVKIHSTLREVIQASHPTVCIVEGLFFAQNLQTALLMGEARGAALVAAAEAGLDIYELAPRKVKQAVVGFGGAQKIAVAKMVQRMLGLAELPAPDAADALALALTHGQEQGRYSFQLPKRI